jgi:hypothetical protein
MNLDIYIKPEFRARRTLVPACGSQEYVQPKLLNFCKRKFGTKSTEQILKKRIIYMLTHTMNLDIYMKPFEPEEHWEIHAVDKKPQLLQSLTHKQTKFKRDNYA